MKQKAWATTNPLRIVVAHASFVMIAVLVWAASYVFSMKPDKRKMPFIFPSMMGYTIKVQHMLDSWKDERQCL